MPYGLKEEQIIKIKTLFAENHLIKKAVLFGSRAKGNFKPGSDVDIALMGSEISFNDLLFLHNKIDELNLPYKFDILIYDQIKDNDVIEHIKRVSVILYEQ